jgi:hypothetical protein
VDTSIRRGAHRRSASGDQRRAISVGRSASCHERCSRETDKQTRDAKPDQPAIARSSEDEDAKAKDTADDAHTTQEQAAQSHDTHSPFVLFACSPYRPVALLIVRFSVPCHPTWPIRREPRILCEDRAAQPDTLIADEHTVWSRLLARRIQMLLGIFSAKGALPLEFKPAYSVGKLLTQHLDEWSKKPSARAG